MMASRAKGRARGRIHVRTPFTDTIGLRFNKLADRFVPGWDKRVAAGQQIDRVKDRLAMGDVKTPRLGGVNIRTKR